MFPDFKAHLPHIQAILFDLDGTLIDTDNQAVARIAGKIRPFLGHRANPVARWLLMKAETPGNLFVTLLDKLGLDEKMMGLTDKLRRQRGLYAAPDFHLIPGVEEMLRQINGRYRLGVVTTRSRYHIDSLFKQYPGVGGAMQTSCGLQDTYRLKPHPSPVQLAAKRLNVPVQNCLMVGDTTVDIISARRAGAWGVGVLCGFGERQELERAGAHAILDSTADIAHFLHYHKTNS